MSYKEIRPGVIRITLEMPTELFSRAKAFAEAQATPYANPNVSLVCRQLIHEGLERAGFPVEETGGKGKRRPKS